MKRVAIWQDSNLPISYISDILVIDELNRNGAGFIFQDELKFGRSRGIGFSKTTMD